ncbi:hypothetical protein NM688_g7321 [Phlebia brevispora]|uniref:Uncharacterized protein n=1 Tax=Phlebia brevispora TaxID=194682 RepID=A0ACC1S6R3_9APHY|nr:hypothetical protein NM688_g7321 [Phlebia brevispora]
MENQPPHLQMFSCKYSHREYSRGGHNFIPVTRETSTKLEQLLGEVELLSSSALVFSETSPPPRFEVLVHSARALRDTPLLYPTESSMFAHLWALSIPVVVTEIQDYRPHIWQPRVFFKGHEDDVVQITIQTKEGMVERQGTLEDFMQLFEMPERERGYIVKLKDYPPAQSFANVYHDHFLVFQHALPFQMYTAESGFYNLAAHFPTNQAGGREAVGGIKPDIGPKMYFASADHLPKEPVPCVTSSVCMQDNSEREGSTRLHLDMSGAVNIMVEDLAGQGALWTIFAAEDTDKVRHYLRHKYRLDPSSPCPIHSQKYYLQKSDLRALFTQARVIPYIFTQRKGEAVCIPAGCAHQVSNNGACIKIAADFVCLSQISTNRRLKQEFHMDRIEDVLGLDLVMWYAWYSLQEQQRIGSVSQQQQFVETPSCQAIPAKRKAADIAAYRARKRLHGPEKKLTAEEGYFCPDPRCRYGAASKRTYSWIALYQHIASLHRRTIPKEVWRARGASPSSRDELDNWYIAYVQEQILEDALKEHRC